MTPVDPTSNGQRSSLHMGCVHEDRWAEIRDDVREIKESVNELKTCVVGAPGSASVPIVTRLTLAERDLEEGKKHWSSWKQGFAAVLIAVVSPLLIWVAQLEFRDHVMRQEPAARPVASPGVLVASPSPFCLVASPQASVATDASPSPRAKNVVAEE